MALGGGFRLWYLIEMKYHVVLKPRAIKDLKDLPKEEASKIIDRLALLEDNLKGDVKRLTHVTPEYRMRSGNYRVLFELEEDRIIVYRIEHRKDIYR